MHFFTQWGPVTRMGALLSEPDALCLSGVRHAGNWLQFRAFGER